MSNNYHTTDFHRCDVAADTCGCGCAPVVEDTACTLPLHDECTCQMPVRDDCGCGCNCGCSCESKPDCCAGVEPDTTSKLPSCCKGSMLSALRMLFRNPLQPLHGLQSGHRVSPTEQFLAPTSQDHMAWTKATTI